MTTGAVPSAAVLPAPQASAKGGAIRARRRGGRARRWRVGGTLNLSTKALAKLGDVVQPVAFFIRPLTRPALTSTEAMASLAEIADVALGDEELAALRRWVAATHHPRRRRVR